MKSAMKLGLRLAFGTGSQRARSLVVVAASAIGTATVLLVWGITESQVANNYAFQEHEIDRLTFGTVVMVALPVLMLVGTMARLSAGLRDRRLANLRLLGMGAEHTRLVAATEVGVASILGTALGVAGFLALAPLIGSIDIAGRDWTAESLMPPPLAWVFVVLGVPLTSMVTASFPQRLSSQQALTKSRPSRLGARHLVRALPLLAGVGLCGVVRWHAGSEYLTGWEVDATIGGIALMAIGMVFVVPVLVTLMAAALSRWGRGSQAVLIGRRLESHPASATRVMSALMVGLFVVVFAQSVIVSFQSTPQYQKAERFIEEGQTAEVTVRAAAIDDNVANLAAIDGVTQVRSFPVLHGVASPDDAYTVLVASCADLGDLPGCTDDGPSFVGEPWFESLVENMDVSGIQESEPTGPTTSVPINDVTIVDVDTFERTVGTLGNSAALVLPPDYPGVAALLEDTDRLIIVNAGPGRYLYDAVWEVTGIDNGMMIDLEEYDFAQGMRTLAWTLSAVVLSIGLLTYTAAGIDRALLRRAELTALRLVGTPAGVLRRAQWWEAFLPTAIGSVLAIVAGGFAGAMYLQLDEDAAVPITSTLTLVFVAGISSMVLAWITTLGTTAKLEPEHIRVA